MAAGLPGKRHIRLIPIHYSIIPTGEISVLLLHCDFTPACTATAAKNFAGTSINCIPNRSNSATTSYIPAVNKAMLATSAAGLPSKSTTLPSGLAATNISLTTPSLGVATATSIIAITPTNYTENFTLLGGLSSTETLTVDATVSTSALAPLTSLAFVTDITTVTVNSVTVGTALLTLRRN